MRSSTRHLLSKVSNDRYSKKIIYKYDHIIFLKLLKSLARLHVEYASTIWSPSAKYLSKKTVQRRASKLPAMVNNLRWDYTSGGVHVELT